MEASKKRYCSLILRALFIVNFHFGCVSVYASDSISGFICVPIAELTGNKLGVSNAEVVYKEWSPNNHARIHQALFLEPVIILEQQETESRIIFPLACYIQGNVLKQCTAWTLTKNIIPITPATDTTNLPSYFDITQYQNPTVALTQPFFDRKTKQIFSAGTRFAIKKRDKKSFVVSAFNKAKNDWYFLKIPDKKCCEVGKIKEKNKQKDQFISLLKSWAHNSRGYIPYVLGGCSICTFDTDPFIHFQQNIFHSCGIDCTGLILRAAQICNIPYFFKNSTTLRLYGNTVPDTSPIEIGDIFWIKGHVFIVSNVDNPSFIEARGYTPHKFGRVQEIELSKVFQGVSSFEQLRTMNKNNLSIARLDKNGIPHDIHKEFHFFRIF